MELKDIGTKELKLLNLSPIIYFETFKTCFEKGYYYKATKYGNRPKLASNVYASKSSHEEREVNDEWEKIILTSFSELSKEDIEEFGYSGKNLFKLLWLQKYLNGEETGCYCESEDEHYQSFLCRKELDEKNKEIHLLRKQLQYEKQKNESLTEELKMIKEEIQSTNKLAKKLQKFLIENQTLFHDFLQELN